MAIEPFPFWLYSLGLANDEAHTTTSRSYGVRGRVVSEVEDFIVLQTVSMDHVSGEPLNRVVTFTSCLF
jgi:RNase P/RNase MRP subunit p29